MGGRFALPLALALGVSFLGAPASAGPNNEPATYELQMGAPNTGSAPNGDTVEITCDGRGGECGTFSVHPKALPTPPEGEFAHKDPDGNVLVEGTWAATELISFNLYGCGVVTFTDPDTIIDEDLCGGALKLRVVLDPDGPGGTFDAILTIFCIVGEKAPSSHDEPPEEGVTMNVPGVINFNHAAGGMNVYEKQ